MCEQSLLVIEDNQEDYHAMVRALKKCGFTNFIHHCECGEEVMEFLTKARSYSNNDEMHVPGLILLDLNLPGMDGKDILAKIRQDELYKKVPVVVLTTSKNERDIKECYEKGANSYIEKPVDMIKFIEAIKRIKEYWFEINILSKSLDIL